MTGHLTAHRADLDEMRVVVDSLAARLAAMEATADRLGCQAERLRGSWDGTAATAHEAARTRWDDGFAAMRAALADLRASVGCARDAYAAAADHNVALWRELA